MRKSFHGSEEDELIHCSNHACGSNGGSNFSAVPKPAVAEDPRAVYQCYWSRRALAAEAKIAELEKTIEKMDLTLEACGA